MENCSQVHFHQEEGEGTVTCTPSISNYGLPDSGLENETVVPYDLPWSEGKYSSASAWKERLCTLSSVKSISAGSKSLSKKLLRSKANSQVPAERVPLSRKVDPQSVVIAEKLARCEDVAIHQLYDALPHQKLRDLDPAHTKVIQQAMQKDAWVSYPMRYPVMVDPAQCADPAILKAAPDTSLPSSYRFFMLGGNHTKQAAINNLDAMGDDDCRRSKLLKMPCMIYVGLTTDEALRVAADHNRSANSHANSLTMIEP